MTQDLKVSARQLLIAFQQLGDASCTPITLALRESLDATWRLSLVPTADLIRIYARRARAMSERPEAEAVSRVLRAFEDHEGLLVALLVVETEEQITYAWLDRTLTTVIACLTARHNRSTTDARQ